MTPEEQILEINDAISAVRGKQMSSTRLRNILLSLVGGGTFSHPKAVGVTTADVGKLASMRDDGSVGPYAYDVLPGVNGEAEVTLGQWLAAEDAVGAESTVGVLDVMAHHGFLFALESPGIAPPFEFWLRQRIVADITEYSNLQCEMGADIDETVANLTAFLTANLVDWDLVSCEALGAHIQIVFRANGNTEGHLGFNGDNDHCFLYRIVEVPESPTYSQWEILAPQVPISGTVITAKARWFPDGVTPVDETVGSYTVLPSDDRDDIAKGLRDDINPNANGFFAYSSATGFINLRWPYWENDARDHVLVVEGLSGGTVTGGGSSGGMHLGETIGSDYWQNNFSGGMEAIVADTVTLIDNVNGSPATAVITAGVEVPANPDLEAAAVAIAAYIQANVLVGGNPYWTGTSVSNNVHIVSGTPADFSTSQFQFDGQGNPFVIQGRPETAMPMRPVLGRIIFVEDTAVVAFEGEFDFEVIDQGDKSEVRFPGYQVYASDGGEGVVSWEWKNNIVPTLYFTQQEFDDLYPFRIENSFAGCAALPAAVGETTTVVRR